MGSFGAVALSAAPFLPHRKLLRILLTKFFVLLDIIPQIYYYIFKIDICYFVFCNDTL